MTTENYTERDYPGSPIRIVSWTDAEVISINVFVGADRSALSKTFKISEREAAATHYAFVQNGARAGRTEAALVADLNRTPVALGMIGGRSVRATKSHVFRQPLTPGQQRLVNFACARSDFPGMLFKVSDKINWLTLRAIVDKGHGEVVDKLKTGTILSIRVKP